MSEISGKVVQLFIETEDERDQLFVKIKPDDGGDTKRLHAYLDRGVNATAIALAQLQLLRDAMINGLPVDIHYNADGVTISGVLVRKA